MKEKIYVIGSAGVPACYGGFETFAENFSLKLSKKYDISVFCSKRNYDKTERKNTWNSVHRIFLPLHSNGIQSILYDLLSLLKSVGKADRIIILGSGIGLFLPLFSKSSRQKIWLHIDGLEWKRSKWNFIIKKYLKISYISGIRFSEKIIIDNEALIHFIPKKYHYKIIESGYGGDHLPSLINTSPPFKDSFALMIARAEPENNFELILKCFSTFNSMHLVVIANWHQTALGRKLKLMYSSHPNISLIGPIFNDNLKLHTFRIHCSLYIHGHSAGGTNPSLIEAMYAGVPIFAFDNVFNRNTTNNYASYFKTGEELLILLKKRQSLDLKASSRRLKNHAMEFHTWDRAISAFETKSI